MNAERHALNWVQLQRFARNNRVPVLRWRRALGLNPKYEFHPEFLETLYTDNALQICQAFASGAPCILSGNIDVAESLCNGTRCTFDSVGYKCSETLDKATLAMTRFPSECVIDIPAPDSIIVRVRKQQSASGKGNGDTDKTFLIPVDESTEVEGIPALHQGSLPFVAKRLQICSSTLKYTPLIFISPSQITRPKRRL